MSPRFLAVNASRRSSCQHVLRGKELFAIDCFMNPDEDTIRRGTSQWCGCMRTSTCTIRSNKDVLGINEKIISFTSWPCIFLSFDVFWNHFPCLVV